jgi:hypothetical protein
MPDGILVVVVNNPDWPMQDPPQKAGTIEIDAPEIADSLWRWMVHAAIPVNSSGASTDDAIDANFVDSEKSSARKRFALGDEITIELDSIDETEVRFIFNERDFGTLNLGDKVGIDDERNVVVNGTRRSPDSAQ